ncbi:MAG: hypothetical protein D3905_00240 [Candidatus Electrothrix sp. AS4_5]|nr:hypothetical protein [Candidatus Electrothrix gigas]
MKPSVPGILCILLSCLLASCAEPPPYNNTYYNTAPVAPVTSISGDLVIYPDLQRNVLHPRDLVLFQFTSTGAAIDINSVQIIPGEPGAPLLECGRNASCTENTISGYYKYKNKGYYNIYVVQNRQVLAKQQILILENYRTDEELRYEAIKGIAAELQPALQKFARGKVAFSALKDANFEYADDQRDVKMIYGLMQALVESNAGRRSSYVILERAPHALVRLAHEAVYTAPKNFNRPKKQKQLEYGLYTLNRGLKEPLVYGINPSGLNDRVVRIDQKGDSNLTREGTDGQKETKPQVIESITRYSKEHGRSHQEALRERPVMFARFDTADFLVVIDRLEDGPVQRSAADYYDPTYNTKAIKRTARIKVNARILDDTGKILWIKNITKQVSDLVLPDYAPPVQIWTESTNRIPSQDTNAASDIVIGY